MKKVISILIALAIAVSSIVTSFAVPLNSRQESSNINSFIDGITELVREYDANKEFTVAENDELSQIQDFSAPNADAETNEVRANTFAASASKETENDNTDTYTLQDFQTARLIVRANGKFDKFGALEDVSGFKDFHILQYESPEAAMKVYEKLKAEKNIINIEPDLIVQMLPDESDELTKVDVQPNSAEHLTPWSLQRTQADRLLDYLETADISMNTVTVAVIDSGLDYNHEFLKDRVDQTGFNSSNDGTPGDEMDVEISHGTSVASVIVDNTPNNVRIKGYKAMDNDAYGSTSGVAAAILKAVADKVDVINLSLSFTTDVKINVDALQTAFDADISVVCAVGNNGSIQTVFAPSNIAGCITVGATDRNNNITIFSDRSWNVDVSAPGQDIMAAVINNQYELVDGTSFSSPCVAALASIIRSIHPNLTSGQIEKKIKDTAQPVNNIFGYVSKLNGSGMVQFCNALDIAHLTNIETNLTEYKYNIPQTCELSCADERAKILYTTDGTYPDISTATEYTAPIYIEKIAQIRAVAYYEGSRYYSDGIELIIRIRTLGDEKDFTITDDGIITKYTGTVGDLIIPDIVNGITVTGIQKNAFKTSAIYGLTLPKTITELPREAFRYNETLSYIEGEGINFIGAAALDGVEYLLEAEFPNVITIDDYAFRNTYNLTSLRFDKLENIHTGAFYNSGIWEIYGPLVTTIDHNAFMNCDFLEIAYFPNWTHIDKKGNSKTTGIFGQTISLNIADFPSLEQLSMSSFILSGVEIAILPSVTSMASKAFSGCSNLRYVYMPNLTRIPSLAFEKAGIDSLVETIYVLDSAEVISQYAFKETLAKRLEFSHLKSAQSLPQTENCIITMPSTFKECTENTAGRNYKIYGTKGTYAEQWANENGHEFIEISQGTAILKDVPMEYTEDMGVLCPDVIGFNRTYQWYANDTADNMTGTPIEGAISKDFNPADYPAKYYYCVVTSTDVGFEPIEIRTGVTANKTLASADYSAVETAEKQIPADLSLYTDESVSALQAVLSEIQYDLPITDQAIVDGYAEAILDAISTLVYKPADLTEYHKVVEQAKAIDRDLYEDLTALDVALAIDVSNKNITEQAEVDAQTQAILNALYALVYKPADFTEYHKAVEQAQAIDRSLYVDLTALDEALEVDVSSKNISEQAEVDAQMQAIFDALNSLAYKPADLAEYYKAVEQAKAIDRDLYEDLTTLDETLKVDVSDKNITEQTEVDAQTQAILNALYALVYKPADFTEYYKVVEQAEAIDRDLYEDLTALDEALAVDMSHKNITEQAEVDAQTQAILSAIDGLVEKEITTEPTEPTEPIAPTEPTNPEIPNTSTEHAVLCGFSFLFLCGAAILTSAHRKEINNRNIVAILLCDVSVIPHHIALCIGG